MQNNFRLLSRLLGMFLVCLIVTKVSGQDYVTFKGKETEPRDKEQNVALEKVFNGLEKLESIRPHSGDQEKGKGLIGAQQVSIPTIKNLGKKDFQQEISVTGAVTSEEGEPLPGVNVVVQGTSEGTVTDVNGEYTLQAPEDGTLVFSFVGYQTQEIQVDGQSTIDVTMSEDISQLDEVVVVGYGTQRKENLTGSVDMAGAERIEDRPIRTLGEGLQGVIPNLNITVSSGDPTDDPDFNVRGFESITGGSPLTLVDGIPADPNRINPSDIENVTVLKDASSAAVYGGRAAFGVVMIETKDPEPGEININFSSQFSADQPIWNMDVVEDPHRYVTHKNQAYIRRDGSPAWSDRFVQKTKEYSDNPTQDNAWGVHDGTLEYYGYNNYQDRILEDYSPMQQYGLDVSGGSEDASYYASVGYMNTDGLFKYGNDNFKRYNFLAKSNINVTDWLELDQRVSLSSEVSDKPHFYHWDVNINSMARQSPIAKVQFPSQEYFDAPDQNRDYSQYEGMYFGGTNWLPYLQQGGRNQYEDSDLSLTQYVTLKPFENFEIRSDFTYNVYTRRQEDVASKVDLIRTSDLTEEDLIGNGFSGTDFVETDHDRNNYYAFNAVGEYELDNEGSPHYFKGMIGFNQEWWKNYDLNGQAYELLSRNVRDISATTGNQLVGGGKSHTALRGAFYRLNYIYDSRYLVEFNGRYDGTSKFPKDDRFGFFPSVSAGWRVSEEAFMAGFDFLDDFKLRGSYGALGNQDVSYYPYITSMGKSLSNYMMGGSRIPSVWSSGLVSPTLTWESVNSRNVGVDLGFFGGALTASFDAYVRETKDMLMDVEYPDLLGTGAPDVNAADLATSGWEFNASYRNEFSEDWSYNVSFNLSDWTSEITSYENPTGAINEYYVGQEIGEIWGYETHSLFQSEQEVADAADQSKLGANWRPGDVRYKDLNGDGQIGPGNNTLEDPGDRKVIGNNTPSYSYGMNFDVSYKGLTLSTFFQGVGQRDVWPPSGNWNWFFPYMAGHIEEYYITESWSEDNRDAYFYAPEIRSHKNTHVQSRYLQDASYLRLKDVRVKYDIPQQILNSIGLQNLSVYASAKNLWEYSNIHKPLDPEYIFSGAIPYPLQRTYTAGINLSF